MDAFSICKYLWTGWLAVWLLWALQSKRTQQRESAASRLSYALVLWAAMYLIFSPNPLRGWGMGELLPYRAWMGWAGVAIAVLGFAITFWARVRLGRNWSGTVTIKVGHELVRNGPYRWVRHPIYTGLIVAMMGTVIVLDQWRGLACIALLWVGFTIKRLKEEQFMRQTFGEQYIEYIQSTGAIFPLFTGRP